MKEVLNSNQWYLCPRKSHIRKHFWGIHTWIYMIDYKDYTLSKYCVVCKKTQKTNKLPNI